MTFPFDVKEALRSGMYIGGTSGSGKTNLAYQLVDKLMQEGITCLVFDPSQAWQTKSSVPNYISIESLGQSLSFDPGKSIIFDISKLYVGEQRQVVSDICKALFDYQVNLPEDKRQWYFVFFEEAQIYLQQGAMRSKAYAEVMRLVTVGRNFKIRYGLLTQFPSSVDKLPVKMSKQRYFGYTDEKNDKDYIQSFLGKELTEELKTLKIGEFYYNSGRTKERIQTPLFQTEVKPTKLEMALKEKETPQTQRPLLPDEIKGLLYIVGFFLMLIFLWYVWTHTSTKYVQSIPLPLEFWWGKFLSLF
jgi:DNA helicase HerA-like ATPase